MALQQTGELMYPRGWASRDVWNGVRERKMRMLQATRIAGIAHDGSTDGADILVD